jgi:hypothetical protein
MLIGKPVIKTWTLVPVLLWSILLGACGPGPAPRPDYPLTAVGLDDVDVTDDFWAPRMEANRRVSLQAVFDMLEANDSFDTSKLIEAAAYMLAKRRDPALQAMIDARIDARVKVLRSRVKTPEQAIRVPGHFFEAAAAYAEATGRRQMLDVAVEIANLQERAYGPGRGTYISGHEGLKIGLVRMARVTGDDKYWKLAQFLLDERGRDDYPRAGEYARDRTYAQDHQRVVRQSEAVGHAVRAAFLYIALADVAALTRRPEYAQAGDRLWQDVVSRKTYLTGGIGSIRFHEQFGAAYHLPNLSAWNETCASYGNIVWNHRLFLLHRDARYIDVMERVLYNAFLAGVSLTGDRFFYQNPLMSYGNYERFTRINTPCCPPNVVRLLASLGSYIYAKGADALYVNLFVGSRARVRLGGTLVAIAQQTRYPWEGRVRIAIDPEHPARFAVHVRVPGWVRDEVLPGSLYRYTQRDGQLPVVSVNGTPAGMRAEDGFLRVEREWRQGDAIEVTLPMPVRTVVADARVQDDLGRIALMRGPLVYSAEWPDNSGRALNLVVPDTATFSSELRPALLGGVQVVTGKILELTRGDGRAPARTQPHDLVAIPYYAWANRGTGEMSVWMAREPERARVDPTPPRPIASVSAFGAIEKSYTGYNDQNDDLAAVYDGFEPLSSADESNLYFRMRPPAGRPASITYRFKEPTTVSVSEVYWVDDSRFCRPPASWRLLYLSPDGFTPVVTTAPYPVGRDRSNRVAFRPVVTRAVRLEIEPQTIPYAAGQIGPPDAMFLTRDIAWREAGIIEWRVR